MALQVAESGCCGSALAFSPASILQTVMTVVSMIASIVILPNLFAGSGCCGAADACTPPGTL